MNLTEIRPSIGLRASLRATCPDCDTRGRAIGSDALCSHEAYITAALAMRETLPIPEPLTAANIDAEIRAGIRALGW